MFALAIFSCAAMTSVLPVLAQNYRICTPTKATVDRCFAPLEKEDSNDPDEIVVIGLESDVTSEYRTLINGTDTEDPERHMYTLEEFEKKPDSMCRIKDKLVAAVRCVEDETRKLCPGLDVEKFMSADRVDDALTYACSQMNYMNKTCIHTSYDYHTKCRRHTFKRMIPSARANQIIGTTTGTQNQTSDSVKSNFTHSPHWNDMEDDEEPWLDVWEQEEGKKIDEEKKCFLAGAPGDASNSSSSFRNIACFYMYRGLSCTKWQTEKCHVHTAHVMVTFMEKMTPPGCVKLMDQCGSLTTTCDAPTCGAGNLVISWAAAVLAVGAFLIRH